MQPSNDDVVLALQATLEALDDELLPAPAAARSRLVASIEGPFRYAPFTGRVARLFDLDVAGADALLRRATRPDAWFPGPVRGMHVLPTRPGPRVQDATALLLRGDPSTHFPDHEHLGEEHVLVLEGAFVNDDGSVVKQGDHEVRPARSKHAFDVSEEGPCVCAYLLHGGFRLLV